MQLVDRQGWNDAACDVELATDLKAPRRHTAYYGDHGDYTQVVRIIQFISA